MALVFPFIGRLTDLLGVRWTALIGQASLPLVYLAYSRMDGDIGTYKLIFIVQSLICITTTGFLAPGLTALLMGHMGFREDCSRADVVGMGCNAGLNGLNLATGLLHEPGNARHECLAA